jgi:ribosomal protein L29
MMTSDSKTILTIQEIEKQRLELLQQLLAERFGVSTRPNSQSQV